MFIWYCIARAVGTVCRHGHVPRGNHDNETLVLATIFLQLAICTEEDGAAVESYTDRVARLLQRIVGL